MSLRQRIERLPPIPGKRYFTIGEASRLCHVGPHILRHWEQKFEQLHPMKRRGNRRYYQREDILTIRQIRALLYEQGFTIDGARAQLAAGRAADPQAPSNGQLVAELEDVVALLRG